MVSSKLSEKDVNEIKLILSDKENIDSINKIAKQFNVTNTTIRAINDGKAWFDDSLSYPIRKYNTKTLGIERKIYEKIVNDLLNSDLQIYEIAKNNNGNRQSSDYRRSRCKSQWFDRNCKANGR